MPCTEYRWAALLRLSSHPFFRTLLTTIHRRARADLRLALATVLLSTLLACIGERTPSASHFVALIEGAPPGLDPIGAEDSRINNPALNLYNSLIQYRPGTMELQLELAESEKLSPDGLRHTFRLRKGVRFHDGSTVSASDVAYTVERTVALGIGVYTYMTLLAGAEIIDDRTVAILLSAPYPGLLPALSHLYILNADLVRANEQDGDWGQNWLQSHEAGSGPYRLVSFEPQQSYTIERFPDYFKGWRGQHIDSAVFRMIQAEGTRRMALENGDADWIYLSSADSFEALRGVDGLVLNREPTLNQLYFAFNTQTKQLRDPRVRQALALAYNYGGHVAYLRRGNATIAQGLLPDGADCFDPATPPERTDLDEARKLMRAAGYPDGGFELSMAFEGTTGETDFFRLLQMGAASLGIKLNALDIEFDAKVANYASLETATDIGTIWIYVPSPDPHQYLFRLAHSSQAGNGGRNFAFYSNARVDQLLDGAVSEMDTALRCDMYREAMGILREDVPFAPVVTMVALSAQYDYVRGYTPTKAHPLTQNVYSMWIERG